jgi:hypothetical protein
MYGNQVVVKLLLSNRTHKDKILVILQVACFCFLLGRGWQLFYWDSPLRVIFWNQGLLSPFVENVLGMSWKSWVTSSALDSSINLITKFMGILYFICAGSVLFYKKLSKYLKYFMYIATAQTIFLCLLKFMAKFFYLGMFIEHALQMSVPIIFYIYAQYESFDLKDIRFIKFMIALTFVGHAMFAVGIHPVPGHFIDMLISVFGCSESIAKDILILAGSMDILASVLLFVKPFEKYALIFTIFWGMTTAFARSVANLDLNLFEMSAHQWILETLYRFPHGLIPLALFLFLRKRIKPFAQID